MMHSNMLSLLSAFGVVDSVTCVTCRNKGHFRHCWYIGFLILGFYCTSKNLLVNESLLVKVRQQVKKDLVQNAVMYNEAGLINL